MRPVSSVDDKRSWRKLYGKARWQRMRIAQLSEHPLCAFCLESEDITAAEVVDHIKDHKGNELLFWDETNLQSLCKRCHDSTKKRMELGQAVVRFGPDGWPI